MKPAPRTALIAISLLLAAGSLAACGKSSKSSTSTTSMPVIPQTTVAAVKGGKVCTDIAAGLNSSVKFAESDSSPDAMRKQVLAAQKADTLLLNEAPASIKPDVEELVAVSNQLFSDLAKVNYDIAGMAPGTEASLLTPQLTTATTHLDAYLKNECGINPGP